MLIPAQFRVDIFSEIERIADFDYDLCILDKTVDELNKIISEQKGANKSSAKLALDLVKAKKLKILKAGEGDVDSLLQEQKDAIIATSDKGLIGKLKDKGIQAIRLRQKKYLKLE